MSRAETTRIRAASSQGYGIWIGTALLLAVVGANALASFFATQSLVAKNQWVEHTRIATGELDAAEAALLNVEAGERGYLYTGDRRYLQPYEHGKPEVAGLLARLANLTADNPVQRDNLAKLRASVQDALSLFERAVALEAAEQHQAAKLLVLTGAGQARMDAVQAVLDDMKAEESRLLAERAAAAQRSERYLLLTIPAYHALTAVLLVLAGLLVSRDMRGRSEHARRLRQLAERERAAAAQLKQTQDVMVRTEKLAAVGRMASTVAHEINNPLEAVTNLIWIARNDPTAGESVRQHLSMADEELRRVAHITRQTLGFYRDTSQQQTVKVREVMDSLLSLFASRIASKQISVRTRYEDCCLLGYPGELRQLLSNLLANALDAVPSQGRLAVKASPSHSWKGCKAAGVRITIADDGCGIPAENLPRLFEPFFTTKESTGTGLGLWVAKQIAEKHSGNISVRSRAHRDRHYTVFSVFLPLGEEARPQEFAVAS
jgi:signal transduction histidine kinase